MNKAKKSSLKQTYQQFMDLVDNKGLSSSHKILDKDVTGFGSAMDEKIKGIPEVKALVRNQIKQSKGLMITWKIKSFYRYISKDENTALYADDIYLDVKSGKELIKMYLRFSVVLNYINNQWKVIHWHGSKPEQVQSEADTYGIDNLKQKNAELEKLVKEKTVDLTRKNRELEIEAALERVRSRAMAMYTSDELKEVAKEMRNQLHLLGQKELETCAIHLWDKSPGEFEAWAALRSPNNKGKIIESVTKFKIKGIKILEENFQNYRNGKKDYVLVNDVAKARQFFEALKTVDPNAYAFLSPTIKNKKSQDISAYWAVADFAGGSLVMVTMNPPEENSRALLRRFADVFGLAFRRFSDLQKAEAQTREAQIEAALERVRSRSMAMHKSEELKQVIRVVLDQFVHLNINVGHAGFYIDYKAHDDMHIWLADPNIEPFFAVLPYFDTPTWNSFLEAKAKGITLHTDLLDFKTKNKFYKSLFKLFTIPEEAKEFYLQCKGLAVSTVLLESVGLYIENFDGTPYTDEENNILLRFGNVFQQAYTRFLDLQKAEAQARESQIQLALERVRARTMAMQDSKELSDTSFLLANQIRELGINAWGCAFHIYGENEEGDYEWFSNEDGYLPFYKTPRKKYFKQYFENRHCEQGIFIKEFKGKACATHYDFLMQIPVVGDALRGLIKSGIALPTSQIDHIIYFEYGYLLFITYKPVPEAHPIFKRFTKEFEQTYIRFLDLQKAEAQAREAQIQLALERVRAKTMAMQKSDELGEAAVLLFKQIKQLGIETYASGFNIWDKEAKNLVSWMSNPTGEINPPFEMPIESFERHRKIYAAWKKNETYYEEDIKDDALVKHYKFLRSFPLLDKAFKKSEAAGIATPDRQVHNVAFFKQGFLLFITLEPHPEWKDIFIRCATVFEQTYTRFNDLKQAEAQAREAQIETALERIRSMVTAMHESNELLDIVVKMRTEFVALGHDAHYFWHMKWTSEKYLKAMTSGDGSRIGMVMELPRKIHSQIKQIADWEKSKEPAVVFVMNVKETLDYVHKMVSWGDFERVDPNMPSEEDIHHIGGLTFIMARTQHGEIGYSLPGMVPHPPQDAVNTLIRFAAVFDLAYRRFEDLKTAEKQNRETQVELALEKVRSRSMGMQKSEELREVIRIVYEQLIQLNIHVEHAGFLIDYKKGDNLHIWLADEHLAPSEVIFPWFDCPPNNAIREAKEKGEDFFFYHLNFEEKNKFYRDLFKLIPGIPEETINYYLHCPGLAGSGVLLESIGLYIENFSGTDYSDEENAVLMRFGKVFQQTYTRFLDLQKAEAQAREAQIEAALERVRARTMAMQKSSELNPTANLLFDQLRHLGAELQGVAFAICNKDSNIVQKWTSIGVFSFPYTIEPAEQNMYEAWNNKIPLYEEVFEGERIKKYYETLMEVPAFKQGLQQLLDAGIPMPTWQKNHAVSFQQGYLLIITTKPFAETQIFVRFGKVFEQTYTRFLDLQKAEAQAREAQIEAALERVRSRSMAMHKSDELLEVINVVSNQLQQLEIRFGFVCFGVIHPQGNLDFWMAAPGLGKPEKIHMPFVNNPITNSLLDAHKKGTRVLTDFFPKAVMLEWSKVFFENNPDSQIMAQSKEYIQESPGLVRTSVILKEIDVFAGKFADKPFTDEQNEIIIRFANVFEQSYIRFLDLQKAEMQAREAKIEVSLEKVRTVALILKKSDEMLDVVQALYEALW
ncbi:MAG: nuclear transport factor 2 family protein, partial [Ferruginibacter sp.]|nr:nuclear transport factor 2 family protein [Ferruginibacter sp.]